MDLYVNNLPKFKTALSGTLKDSAADTLTTNKTKFVTNSICGSWII